MNGYSHWLRALRYGWYPQARNSMYLHNHTGYDVLGVACREYQNAIGGLEIQQRECSGGTFYVVYQDETYTLPNLVREWLGLRTAEGTITSYYGRQVSLGLLEFHHKYSFKQLAEVIAMKPPGLFES